MSTPELSEQDQRMAFAVSFFEGAPLEYPGVLLTGGSSDDVLIPFVGAALLAHGIETDWSRGTNRSSMTGPMSAGIAQWRALTDVHEAPGLTTAGTVIEADHYVGPATWAALFAGAADRLDTWQRRNDPPPAAGDGSSGDPDDGLEANTVAELEAIAADEGVDLTGINRKAEIIDAILAARAAAAPVAP